MATKSADDGFVIVEKKFRNLSVNKKKNSKRNKKYIFKDSDEYTLQDLNDVLDKRRKQLIDSRFYRELLDLFEKHLAPEKPHDMICYGIGSMQNSKNAQYQFVLALLMRDLLKIPGEVWIYDPVMTELDMELSRENKINVIDNNENGKRNVTKPTLFYMPHCGRGLYSNTLSANWNNESLSDVIIVGNRFDMYVGSQLDRDLQRECPYLIPAVKVMKTLPFPNTFDDNQVFNDLAIQVFPKLLLPPDGDPFWQSVATDRDNEV